MKTKTLIIIIVVVILTGCQQPVLNDSSFLDALIDVATSVAVANTASTPVNPYALPIGIGLAGVTAMLEALRRKERAGRKHAETKLNGSNNNH